MLFFGPGSIEREKTKRRAAPRPNKTPYPAMQQWIEKKDPGLIGGGGRLSTHRTTGYVGQPGEKIYWGESHSPIFFGQIKSQNLPPTREAH